MTETRRAGRPLPTSPEEFRNSRLPQATLELNAALNLLLTSAGLGYKDVVQAHGLGLDAKQTSRQMRESKTGPSQVFYNAILASVAPRVGRSLQDLHTEFDPQLQRARGRSDTPAPASRPVYVPSPTPRGGGDRRAVSLSPGLTRDAEWLASLLESNDEQRAVDELDEIFNFSDLVEVLIYLATRLDPGMPAALIEEIRRRDFPRGSRLFAEISARSGETAARIAAVSPPQGGDGESTILERDPMVAFGRRLAGVIKKGDVARARREVVVRAGDLVHGSESLLGSIIDSDTTGPILASELLSAMADKHVDQMFLAVVQLIRHARAVQRPPLLTNLYQALRPMIRTEILMQLSCIRRLPNEIGLEGDEINDLIEFVRVQREYPDHLRSALLDPRLTRADQHGVGHLIEAVSNLVPILDAMLQEDREQTTRLLACALQDWDDRLRPWTGIPGMYRPLVALGEAVLQIQDPALLVSDLIIRYPVGGWLLFEAMPWLDTPPFLKMVTTLTRDYPLATRALTRMVDGVRDTPQGQRFLKKLTSTEKGLARPILSRFTDEHLPRIQQQWHRASESLSSRRPPVRATAPQETGIAALFTVRPPVRGVQLPAISATEIPIYITSAADHADTPAQSPT